MSEELEIQAEPVEEAVVSPVRSFIVHWKRADDDFTEDDRAAIANSLGLPVEEVVWSIEDEEIDGVAGHALSGFAP